MKDNALRKELRSILASADCARTPALRRSREKDWLYASDAPSLTDADGAEALRACLFRSGWETQSDSGWIRMRKKVKEPPAGWDPGGFGTEASCCLSLLERHPNRTKEGTAETVSFLIREGEKGRKAYEAACREVHTRWAERLKEGLPLPDISPAFFGACRTHRTKEE